MTIFKRKRNHRIALQDVINKKGFGDLTIFNPDNPITIKGFIIDDWLNYSKLSISQVLDLAFVWAISQ